MKAERYLNLRIGAPKRLAILRKANPSDWRLARRYGFKNWEAAYGVLSQGFNGTDAHKVPIWYDHMNGYFRNEQPAHKVLPRMRHTGWYSDAGCQETVYGIVANLNHGRFISGYHMTMNGEQVWFDEVFDDVEDAARNGDSEAESNAEREKEYDERWQAAREISEDKIPEKIKRRTECLLLARINHDRERMREEACNLKSEIKDLQYELRHDYKDIEF